MTHAHDPHLGVRQGMTHDPHLGVRQGMMRDPHLGVRHSRRQGMTHECTTLTWGSGTCYNNMCACDCALTVPCGFALRALFRVPGFHGFQGSRVSWAPGFQGSRVPGFQGSRVPGFQGSRVPGFQGFRVSGFQGFRVSGFQGLCGQLDRKAAQHCDD